MKKWVRNIIVGIVLNNIKNSKPGKSGLEYLKTHKTIVGRTGIAVFSVLGLARLHYPELPVDESIEVFGIIFSWLALELGLEKIKHDEVVKLDELLDNAAINVQVKEKASNKES